MGKSKDWKGNKGRSKRIECDSCGRLVPIEKAIKQEKFSLPIDKYLWEELEKSGTQIHISSQFVYFCFSCARHRKIIKS